ncbi:MAG: hypothetical protein K9M03_04475 [Kiritimatiellales bacterium]|nr:hypothetical protein [Kiritimatiellales bacterium]
MKTCSYVRALSSAVLISSVVFIIWMCLIKIHAPDFWWNLKAGQIIREFGWITTEPFAYTREGMPYLAIHSWLSQVIISIAYGYGGAGGVIMLRTLIVISTFGVLLIIDTKRIWPNFFPILLGAIVMRGAIFDRPLIFTFLMLACALYVTFKLLEVPESSQKIRTKYLIKWIVILMFIHVLWINLHGGAALLSFGLLGAVLLQKYFDLITSKANLSSLLKNSEAGLMILGLLLLILGSIITPNSIHTLEYVYTLFTDQTKDFIMEWIPLDTSDYWKQLWFFWFIAVVSFGIQLRKPIACGIILIALGYMSFSASRHTPLFIITSLGITFYQLKYNKQWGLFMNTILQKKLLAIVITIAAFIIVLIINDPVRSMLSQEKVSGVGTYEPLKSAYEFIEESQPSGNMFNSYSVGQYLEYRGYPDRKVFIDGRNVDHGYEFMSKTLYAAYDIDLWKELESTYNFTYAIIDYRPKKDPDNNYLYGHLDENPRWHLVFIDDLYAVYFKDIPEHLDLIKQYEYKILTTDNFGRMTVFDDVDKSQARDLADELIRQSDTDSRGIISLIVTLWEQNPRLQAIPLG